LRRCQLTAANAGGVIDRVRYRGRSACEADLAGTARATGARARWSAV